MPAFAKKSSYLLIIFLILIKIFNFKAEANSTPSQFSKFTSSSSPKASSPACNGIPYKSACESLVSSLKTSDQTSPKELFDPSVQLTFKQARLALQLASSLSVSHQLDAQLPPLSGGGGLVDCAELLDDSLELLSNIINRKKYPKHTHDDVQTWLSASLTNQETCIDSLQNDKPTLKGQEVREIARNLSQQISNSLALYMSHYYNDDNNKNGRKLLSENGKFPAWVSESERKLLETPVAEIKADAVVARDGSGTHRTIGEAIEYVISRTRLEGESGGGGGRNVIYIKAGTYNENIKLSTGQKNVMLVGDGKGKSVIVASRSADKGYSTFQTATVSAMGDGFIAKDITIVNSAGPSSNQAVALRVASDRSVIYQCSLQGYQDTLYTHSKRQFYRDTDIYGTVDFIFGNSAVVFQNCNLFGRQGSERNYVTAQGRTDPNQNTGISIHNCRITSGGGRDTYLGRPWKQYSRVVVMQSFLDGSVNPAGWFPWSGSFALSTLYYGEYGNSGPGASTAGRVKWPGYKGLLSPTSAQTFTVGSFIQGNQWLPSTGVSFDSGLIG